MKVLNKKNILIMLILACVLMTTVSCGNEKKPGNTASESTETNHSENDSNATESNSENSTEASGTAGYTYKDFSKTMYVKANINVRNAPSTSGEKVGSLVKAQSVEVTGQCNETSWYRIKFNGDVAYVSNEYVTEDKSEVSSWVAKLDAAQTTTQIIVVAGEGTQATVSMHTKDANGIWKEDFSTEGRLGKNGLGKEKEGDGKTPIGIYHFTKAFGVLSNPGITVMPYVQVDDSYHWVDDPESKYYNQFVTTKEVEVAWNSSEHLAKIVPSYNYVLALDYNKDCTPYVGCAIFLHCPNTNFTPTQGCISIPKERMVEVMKNLRSDCIILIDSKTNVYNY